LQSPPFLNCFQTGWFIINKGEFVMKKFLTIVLVTAILALSFSGCTSTSKSAPSNSGNGTGASSKTIKVAVIVPTTNEWNQVYFKAAQEKAKELGMEVTMFDPQNDVQKQVNFVNSCVSQKFDAITIQPIDNAALAQAMKRAAQAGVIVVSHYDIPASLGINDIIYQVLFGQKESGIMEADEYVKLAGDSGEVGIIGGLAGADNTQQRSAGIHQELAKYPNIKIDAEINCSWDRQLAMTATQDMITAHPNLKAIISMDDTMSLGIYQAIKAAGKENQIKVATQGFAQTSIQPIKDGDFMFTIAYPPSSFAEQALQVIKDVVGKKSVERSIVLGMSLVTKDNVDTAKY
jgi:ABC-type sugar transport system substrate-binding protein